jgi:hypothetical protein
MRKMLKCLTILLLSLVLSMTCLSVSEAKVEAINNKIVMDVQDAIDLYRYIAQLEAENKALREGLERERQATDTYIKNTASLIDKYEQERLEWQRLEKSMNAELYSERASKYKTAGVALVLGALIGAVAD